jgi:hypothetical protein
LAKQPKWKLCGGCIAMGNPMEIAVRIVAGLEGYVLRYRSRQVSEGGHWLEYQPAAVRWPGPIPAGRWQP